MTFSISTAKVFRVEVLVFVLTFSTSILIARKLGLNALGIWAILRLISSYLECFGRLKTEAAVIYFIGKNKYKRDEIFLSSLFINFIMIGILYTFSYFNFENIYTFFFKNSSQDFRFELKFVMGSIIFQFLFVNFTSLFPAIKDFKTYNKLFILNTLLTLFLTFICLLFTPFGVSGLCVIYSLSPLICLFYSFRLFPRRFIKTFSLNYLAIKDVFIYSIQFYLIAILQELQQSGSRLITASFLAPTAIAFLDQGQKFSSLLQKTVSPLQVTLIPLISSSDKEKAIKTVSRVIRVYSIMLLFASIILYISINPIINILYGEKFLPIATIVYFLIPSIFLKNITSIISCFYIGTGKAIKNVYLQILTISLQLPLTIFFIKQFGYIGVVYSILISTSIYSSIFIIYFLSTSKLKLSNLFPNLSDFKYIFSFIRNFKE